MRRLPILIFILASVLLLSPLLYAGLKWPAFHASAPIVGAPIVGGTTIFALSADGILYAVDDVSGGQLLPYNLGGPASTEPVSDGNALYAATDDGQVTAISLSGSQRLWHYPSTANVSSTTVVKGLAAGGGLVYLVTSNQTIAINASTGAVRWARSISNGGGPAGADEQRVYVADGGILTAFSSDGVPLWSLPTGALFKTRPVPDSSRGMVYVSTVAGHVLAISSADGTIQWSYPLNGWAMSSPAPAGDFVVFGANDGRIRAVHANSGQLLWATPVGGAVWSQPLIAQNPSGEQRIVLAGTRDDSIVALNLTDGALLWSYSTSDWTGSPSVGPGGRSVLAGSRDGALWAVLLSPICTIDSPRTGQVIGPNLQLRAHAWAWAGVQRVRIGVGSINLPALSLNGSGPFNLSVDLSRIGEGDVPIVCMAEDSGGLVETDAAGAKATLLESLAAPRENMSLTVSSPVEPGAPFNVWVRNADGFDLSDVLLDFNGVNQTLSSPGALNAPLREGTYALTARRDGFSPATSNLVVRGSNGGLLVSLLIAILAVMALFYWFVLRKKPLSAPTDYSKLQ